jgi:peptidoglycan/xylan/chitin deacetylase (PgdA/CDA1 family)
MFPPIAMLHHVTNSPHDTLKSWSVSEHKFLELLNFLETNKYETITFKDIVSNKKILRGFSKKVILTFDDCYKNLLDFAVPQLVKRKMKAVFYMPTAYVGSYNEWDVEQGFGRVELMSQGELKELDKLGMEVGGHSHYHIRLKDASPGRVKEEVEQSKAVLENIIGKSVYSFAYPHGSVPDNYYQILSSAGYAFGVSIHQPLESKLALRRFSFDEADGESSLKTKLSRQYKYKRMFYDNVAHAKGKMEEVIKEIKGLPK